MLGLSEERLAPVERDRARLPGGRRSRRRAAAADHGAGDADARLGRGFLLDAGRTRLPRRSLRQPRHRPLDQDRVGGAAAAHRHAARPPPHRALPAARHGRGHDRADGPSGDRVGAPGRRLDGRDDRPDGGDPPARAGALAGLDDVDDRQPLARRCPPGRRSARCFARPGAGREAAIEHSVRVFGTIGSPGYPMDEERMRTLAGDRLRPLPQPRRRRPPAARGHRLGRPHRGAAQAAPAGDDRSTVPATP